MLLSEQLRERPKLWLSDIKRDEGVEGANVCEQDAFVDDRGQACIIALSAQC